MKMIDIRGYEHELKTKSFIRPDHGKRCFQTVFQLFGKRFFASTAYRQDMLMHGWETRIFPTSQELPESADEIDVYLVDFGETVYRIGYLEEPIIEWHEGAIKRFAELKIKQREGKVNG